MILCFGPSPTVQRTMVFAEVRKGGVNRCIHSRQYASGKAINAARVIHTIGEDVHLCGLIGGTHAAIIREDLAAAGIPFDYEETGPQTRLCVTVLDKQARTATELVEESLPITPQTRESLIGRAIARMDGANAVVMAGSIPAGLGEDVYALLVKSAIGKGVRTIVDARDTPLLLAAEAGAFVVKPNRSELASTLGITIASQSQLFDAMKKLIERGSRWVVVTQGPGPTLLTDGNNFWQVSVPHVDATSPIGSGDALAGGLAVGLVRGMDVPEAARLASACGVANALTPDAGHVDAETVRRLTDQVRVQRVA